MHLDVSPRLAAALSGTDLPEAGAVFEATMAVAGWEEARETLMRAFTVSQAAARSEAPVVYVVHGDDLLGRRGAPAAMVATGLLSAARTAAIELSRKGAAVNVVAVGEDTPPGTVAHWVAHLAGQEGPTGSLLHLHPGHLGKALP